MTRVQTTDHVLLVLREKLARMDRRRAGAADAAKDGAETPSALARLQALVGNGEIGQDELGRTLVRALMAEEVGDSAAQAPAFQAVADRVYAILAESEDGRALVDRAKANLLGD